VLIHRIILGCLLVLSGFVSAGPGSGLINSSPSQFTQLGSISIHYKMLGEEGPVTLLVHGGGCDMTFWELQAQPLLEQGRVLLLDLPGHGQSDVPTDVRYSMKFYAESINQVMEAANVDSAVVVGHSLGVPALRELYRARPEKVNGFVAVDGILIYEPIGWGLKLASGLLDTWLYDYLWPTIVDDMTSEATPKWGRDKVSDTMKNAPKIVVRSFFKEMFHPETAINDGLEAPLLALIAEGPLWNKDIIDAINTLNDDATTVVLEGAGHFLMLEKPNEFNRHLTDFNRRFGKL
jgi:pimeloyl-ACP methyl ester carboxylesterase